MKSGANLTKNHRVEISKSDLNGTVRGVFDEKPEFCYKSQEKGHRKKCFLSFFNLITHYPHALCMVVRQLVVGW